ncbi:MAG: hypothetical protein NTV52_29025 [Acidobacteria bacterium]|nr:hypothetical protein [Acidobacteriota bacterium]
MSNFPVAFISLILLWFFTGLGPSFLLTRRTPLFRYFVWLSFFFSQLVIVLATSLLGTYQLSRLTLTMMLVAHGTGLLLTAIVLKKLGLRRFWRFARYRITVPLASVLVLCIAMHLAPCLDRGQACFVVSNNHEFLNYSSSAQWLNGQAEGPRFDAIWKLTTFGRFGAELMLAFAARTLGVPAIYAIVPLQAILKLQYVLASVLVFHLLFPGVGWRRRWGAAAVALFMALSPLEIQNYLLAFLAHHTAAPGLAIFCATMLLRPSLSLAVLQGCLMLYMDVVYIEIIPVLAVLLGAYFAWYSLRDRSPRPMAYWAAILLAVYVSIFLRDSTLPARFIIGLGTGAGSGGFDVFGQPKHGPVSYLANFLSLRAININAFFSVNPWIQAVPVLFGLAYLALGLFWAGVRQRHLWVLLVAGIVVAAHIDRGALFAGNLQLLAPIYQGPKSFTYFHFLFVAMAVAGTLSARLPALPPAALLALSAVWFVPVVVTGLLFVIREQSWPAVWSANDDLALAGNIPAGGVVTIGSNRDADENLWAQLLAYKGSTATIQMAAQPKKASPAAYLVANQIYSIESRGQFSARDIPLPCPSPLGRSQGFTLCPSLPKTMAADLRIKGTLATWDSPIQPIATCGDQGYAVYVGLQRVAPGRAAISINFDSQRPDRSDTFDFQEGQPFQFDVHLNRTGDEIKVETKAGPSVTKTIPGAFFFKNCALIVGRNLTESGAVSKQFNGQIQAEILP